ncbi:hypothetical protein FRACYDRAFT_252602 [Fragilariopsis cylindrus CCMP1102]|uniref:Uncharacterized protein n=1 Tax=Fragilariopsis cylindrus CCMP1102 TaxID=635003 RepID=A0A1E7EM17_9STRA|nr:hypothetical protein FRACYDRAFT_252602 [Fragilariopsis cylindrus CCMP1102]|eukprot:OEU06970.1 hypothetical protein FRACYDRAFT_252602 [Fragilariopsis cylindrus CCMP1102]
MLGDGVNENIIQLFFDKRYYSMLSTLINDIQTNSNNYGDNKDIMASSPTAVADLVKKILSESERYEVTTLHVVWTIILWMFGNFLQKNLYDVRLYGGTGYSILHHRRLPRNGTMRNITTRIVSALLVNTIVYSLPFFFIDQDAHGEGGAGGEEDHEVNDTTKWFANYFVTGFSSIVFDIVIRRIQISAFVSTILFLSTIVVGIVVLNSDITNASLLLDMGYENEKDSISIFTIYGLCLLLAGWYCCAGITTRIFGYKKIILSSFPCFLLGTAILTLPSLQNLIFEILGSIWKYFGEILR